MTRSTLVLVLGACAAVGAAGCAGNSDGRQAVSGSVTIAGAPLNDASILFLPLDGQDTTSGAPIADGKYAIESKDGLKPGKYKVQITAGDGKTVANEEEAAAPGGSTNIVSVDRIPPEWNVASDKQIEVKASGENNFDFAVPHEYVPKFKKRTPKR